MLHRVDDAAAARTLRAWIDVTQAVALFSRGDGDGAFAALDEADSLLRDLPPTPVHSLAVARRATLHGRAGEWERAREMLEGIDTSRPEVAPRTRTLVHLNLGLAYQFLSRYSESDVRLRRAHRLASTHGYDELAVAATHNRGRLQMLLGNLPGALELMAAARDQAGDTYLPVGFLDTARVLAEAGLIDRAVDALDHGATAARRGRLVHELAETELERARLALLRGEAADARDHGARAERRFRAVGETAWAAQAALLRMESDLVRGRFTRTLADEAVQLADGVAASTELGTEAAVLATEITARAGRLDDARRLLARSTGRRTPSFSRRVRHTMAVAEVHRAEGRADLYRRELRRGATLLATEQARYTSLDSRTAAAVHARRLRDAHLDLALESGSAREVFGVTELWRGVSQRLPSVIPSPDAEIARLTTDARRLHLAAREEPDPRRRADLEAGARRAEKAIARRDLHAQTQLTTAERQASASCHQPVTVHGLRPLLATTRSGMVSLFVHRGRVCAVTVTERDARLHLLPDGQEVIDVALRLRADLTARQHAVGTPMLSAVERSMRKDAADLARLLGPALPPTERVVILPSRGVASVPWRLVPGLMGRPVTVAPSATFWARRRMDEARASSVLAVAGPGLPRAAAETEEVARAWDGSGRSLAGQQATGAALVAGLRDADVVHVAAHGMHQDESPLFSSVVMADGPLWVHEVQQVEVRASHAVLSSCEVGRTHMREGDEGLGLTAGLLACGLHCVVAAVAPVSDESAHALMTAYHQLLAAGVDTAEALERASADLPEARLFCTYGTDWRAPSATTRTHRAGHAARAQMKIAGSANRAS